MGSFKFKNFSCIILMSLFVFSLMSIIIMTLKTANIIPAEIANNTNIYSLIITLITLIININIRISYRKWPWEIDKKEWWEILCQIITRS